MTSNPFCWVEIYVQDMTRARKFYESVFECQLQRLNTDLNMWAFPSERDGMRCSGALVQMDGFPSGGNSTIAYFSCADCAVEAARAQQSGGRIQKDKFSIGEYGFIAIVADLDGNLIGLHSLH